MSQIAATMPMDASHMLPPPLPVHAYQPPQRPVWPDPATRGPIGGPPVPYRPETFGKFYLWWAILAGCGFVLAWVVIGIPMLIAAVVLKYMFLYKAWNQIQDGYQRTSPGAAVGFCFIPFFNLYWMFVAWLGLAQDMNAYARRYGVAIRPISETLPLVWCILFVVSFTALLVPPLSVITGVAALVIAFFSLMQIKDASEMIAQARLNAYAQRAA